MDLPTLRLKLVDVQRYEVFTFRAGGIVAATLGATDGALTAPVLYWRVVGRTLIISVEREGRPFVELGAAQLSGSVLSVSRGDGVAVRYRVERHDI